MKKEKYISVEEAAIRIKVEPSYILKWAREGRFKSKGMDTKNPKIEAESLFEFARRMPPEWREAFGELMLKGIQAVYPEVQREVNEGFRRGMTPYLNKLKEVITFLQELHSKYEKQSDLFNEKTGKTAALIVYARVIAMLQSIMEDFEKENYTAITMTLRPLFEATHLTEYFSLAHSEESEQSRIKAWFEKDAVIMNKDIRGFLAKNLSGGEIEEDELREKMGELFDLYSKPVHHTYRSIMETYQGFSMDGFVGKKINRIGFDYSNVSNMRQLVPALTLFESVVFSALQSFIISFGFLPLAADEHAKLIEYKDYLEERQGMRDKPQAAEPTKTN